MENKKRKNMVDNNKMENNNEKKKNMCKSSRMPN